MPYLKINTNAVMDKSDETRLAGDASKEVANLLGKPESYVMVEVNSSLSMSFAGSDDPLAYLELKSIGLADEKSASFSKSLCSFIADHTRIEPARIYIEFANAERHLWGWNSSTF